MSGRIIHVLCEGQTEQGFVEGVLKPYLMSKGIEAVKSVLVTTNKKLNARGGMLSYDQAKRDLELMEKTSVDGEYEKHILTTMFDLYALPDDFPGYVEAMRVNDRYARVKSLEQAFASDIDDMRFVPYIQLHEFEALVLCGIDRLKDMYPDCGKGCKILSKALESQPNPELINDGSETAPSKRIIKAIEEESETHYNYNKPKTGRYITGLVGIDTLRGRCRHFDEWIGRLLDARIFTSKQG